MPRYTRPRRTWHYLSEFEVKAVQLSLLDDIQVKDVATTRPGYNEKGSPLQVS